MLSAGVWHRHCRISGRLSRRSAACRRFHRVWWSWLCLLVHSCSAVRAVIKRICRHKKRLFASATDSSPILDRFTVVTRDIFSCPVGFRRLVCPLIPIVSRLISRSIFSRQHNHAAACVTFCTARTNCSVIRSICCNSCFPATKRTVFQFNLTHVLSPPSPAPPLPPHSCKCRRPHRMPASVPGSVSVLWWVCLSAFSLR